MPHKSVKTVKQVIYWQYAKIVSESAGMGKKNYGMVMNTYKKLCDGSISWSSTVREWLREREQGDVCIYCGNTAQLTTDHILPRVYGGEDIPDNVVSVCKSCNSSKGCKGLYEWRGLKAKDNHHRIAEGKYLKYLYSLHERQGSLDKGVDEICGACSLGEKCVEEGHEHELTVYCIEGCFLKKTAGVV